MRWPPDPCNRVTADTIHSNTPTNPDAAESYRTHPLKARSAVARGMTEPSGSCWSVHPAAWLARLPERGCAQSEPRGGREQVPDGLYERDALAWAGQQADILRRLAAGERVNESVDWTHVIEEVQDVGRSELRACQSLLRQALLHLLKLHAWPDSPASGHWRGEAVGFLADARRAFSPSMRQHLDLGELHADALDGVRAGAQDLGDMATLPQACPFTADELLGGRPDIGALVARLADPKR